MTRKILSPKTAADIVERDKRTLMRWRETGGGPPYIRLGPKMIGYPEDLLLEWLKARTFDHRAQESDRLSVRARESAAAA